MTGYRVSRRGLIVVASTANSLVVPAVSALVSLLVVRLASVERWGAFVNVMIVVQLAAHVVGWGNKEHLLRAFSVTPAHIAEEWQTSLITRLALLAPLVLLAGLPGHPARLLALALLWCLGMVLHQSTDVLIVYRKDFVFSIAVELAGVVLLIGLVAWRGARLTVEALVVIFGAVAWLKAAAFLVRVRAQVLSRRVGRFSPRYFRVAALFLPRIGMPGAVVSSAAAQWLMLACYVAWGWTLRDSGGTRTTPDEPSRQGKGRTG